MVIELGRLLLFPSLMAFAASTDLFSMTISNRVTALLVLGFFLASGLDGLSAAAIASHLAAGLAVLAVSFVCFSRRWIGGGDAKLAAATALWFGWPHLYEYLLYASVLGGVLTLLLLEFRRHPLPEAVSRWAWVVRLHKPDAGVPYGIALAVAALLIYPSTPWMSPAGL
jgi:prepilin peptidase CpaA